MPEAALAREIGLCYAAIAIVVNYAAGRGASEHEIRLEDIRLESERARDRVGAILEQLVMLDGD
jgi:5'-methylthioadenosine phosphorylase